MHPKTLGNKGLWNLELLGNIQVKIKSVLSISETDLEQHPDFMVPTDIAKVATILKTISF